MGSVIITVNFGNDYYNVFRVVKINQCFERSFEILFKIFR